jgi:hypothetical protein
MQIAVQKVPSVVLRVGLLFMALAAFAQSPLAQEGASKHRLQYLSAAFTNNHSAYPFSSFASLVTGEWHPGFEVGTGFNWKVKKRHDWYQEFRIGYFYHQFVQHGIPLYTSFGYRYKFGRHWQAQAGLGAGYLHSIPAHDRAKLNSNGEYELIKDAGRAQAMVVFNLGVGYNFALHTKHPWQAFLTYQQRIQTPYVKSYVPLFPYNSLMVGFKRSLHKSQ